MLNRRRFVAGAVSAAAVASHALRVRAQASAPASELDVVVDRSKTSATVPLDFTGVSYESAQLGHPDFFAPANAALIGLFRTLGASGVLRIGGNTGEYTTWSDNDADAEKNHTPHAMGPDAGTAAKTASIITPVAIRNLRAFIDRVPGWRIIYGLNLWHGTPENAAAEAAYVQKTLGDKLICFQIGNEPDMDHDQGSKERWTFDHYWERWNRFRTAVLATTPAAKFAGPDIAKEYSWITAMAEKRPDIVFLSGHYYAEGPPADPRMTLEFLLHRGRNPATEEIGIVHAATQQLGRGYRMSEGNSCFHGGKPLVSDTLASALWGGDYMLQLAEAGYLGVNLHGGGNGLYTPIAGDTSTGFNARPVYYGMLLAGRFAGATMVSCSILQQTDATNVTAFAARAGKTQRLAIFNKGAAPVRLKLGGIKGARHLACEWLQGPSIDSHTGILLGGSSVGPAGEFSPKKQLTVNLHGGRGELTVPAYTAVLLEG